MLLDSDGKAAAIAEVHERVRLFVRAFVETGTAVGDLPLRLADRFDTVVTIEADDHLFASAQNRLRDLEHVHVVHGDSGVLLGDVLDELDQPCLIWLDAHEIADDGHAAMRAELEHIAASPHQHVLLIDDARLCSGRKGWCTLDELAVWAHRNGYRFAGVHDDVVHLLPE